MNLKKWHKAVCERDKYVCQICEKNFNYGHYFNDDGVNQYVCGHHVKRRGSHPELKQDVDNGQCICLDCHNKEHNGE